MPAGRVNDFSTQGLGVAIGSQVGVAGSVGINVITINTQASIGASHHRHVVRRPHRPGRRYDETLQNIAVHRWRSARTPASARPSTSTCSTTRPSRISTRRRAPTWPTPDPGHGRVVADPVGRPHPATVERHDVRRPRRAGSDDPCSSCSTLIANAPLPTRRSLPAAPAASSTAARASAGAAVHRQRDQPGRRIALSSATTTAINTLVGTAGYPTANPDEGVTVVGDRDDDDRWTGPARPAAATTPASVRRWTSTSSPRTPRPISPATRRSTRPGTWRSPPSANGVLPVDHGGAGARRRRRASPARSRSRSSRRRPRRTSTTGTTVNARGNVAGPGEPPGDDQHDRRPGRRRRRRQRRRLGLHGGRHRRTPTRTSGRTTMSRRRARRGPDRLCWSATHRATRRRSGVAVVAATFQNLQTIVVGGAVSGSVGIAGSAAINVLSDTTLADIGAGATVNATDGTPGQRPGRDGHGRRPARPS